MDTYRVSSYSRGRASSYGYSRPIADNVASHGIGGQLSEFTATAKTVMAFEVSYPRSASTDMPIWEFRLIPNASGNTSVAGNGMQGGLFHWDGGTSRMAALLMDCMPPDTSAARLVSPRQRRHAPQGAGDQSETSKSPILS